MPTSIRRVLLCSLVLLACGKADDPDRRGTSAATLAQAKADSETAETSSQSAMVTPDSGALRPIMQRLALNMSALANALWVENYDEMAERSRLIAEHPPMSRAEIQRIRTTLGNETPAFDAIDEQVHEASHRMYAAAQARQLGEFLRQYGQVQEGCTSCHTQFRDRIRAQP